MMPIFEVDAAVDEKFRRRRSRASLVPKMSRSSPKSSPQKVECVGAYGDGPRYGA